MPQTVHRFDRLTVEADKLVGQVCIRGYRFTVEHLLELLAGGWDLERIQSDFPFIEDEDVRQTLGYAAALAHREVYPAAGTGLKLLVDQNLPRRHSALLQVEGHDALHTEQEGVATAADPLILPWCCTRARLLVTASLPPIERVVLERGNAPFSLTPGRPIRAELLPLGLIGPTADKAEPE